MNHHTTICKMIQCPIKWKIGGEIFVDFFLNFWRSSSELVVWESLYNCVTYLGSYVEACQNAWENK